MAQTNKTQAAWKRWVVVLVLSLMISSAFLGFFTSFILSRLSIFEMLFTLTPTDISIPEMNVLLMGVDATPGAKRTDAIMVVNVNPVRKAVTIVSIPRDTLVVIPGMKLDKINHAYAYGGPELACSTTSNFLGVKIDKYIKVNINKLEELIDKIGGVTIDVDERLYYVDYAGGLFIDLKPGRQRLNGKQAIGYLRFRHDAAGDFGRIKRQQVFLQAVASEIIKSKNFVQIYAVIMDLMGSVETNLYSSQIFSMASVVRESYENANIALVSLPGTGTKINGIYYLQPDNALIEKVVKKYFRRNENEGQ